MIPNEDEIKSCWVFDASTWCDDNTGPVLAGKYTIDETGIGRFVYGKSYLARDDATPFDPIHLPLEEREFSSPDRFHPDRIDALSDAGPDRWGQNLMMLHKRKPKNTVEVLLSAGNHGVGALAFSGSRTMVKRRSLLAIADLRDYLEMAAHIEKQETVPPALIRLLDHGTSMGGARPKTLVSIDGQSWLAKFNRKDDLLGDEARVEYATLALAAKCEIATPATELINVADKTVLLVKRFDRVSTGNEQHSRFYISAQTALGFHRPVRPQDYAADFSYMGVARTLARHGAATFKDECRELYCRMIFNAMVGNNDDHLRNHGFFIGDQGSETRSRVITLAPAYDLVPQVTQTNPALHFLGLGRDGAIASRDNLLSAHENFYLTREEAESLYDAIHGVTAEWRTHYREHGVDERSIDLMARCFQLADEPKQEMTPTP
jgi:serine/threonine-protein kinase HipA